MTRPHERRASGNWMDGCPTIEGYLDGEATLPLHVRPVLLGLPREFDHPRFGCRGSISDPRAVFGWRLRRGVHG